MKTYSIQVYNQGCVTLVEEQTHRSVEQGKEPRSKLNKYVLMTSEQGILIIRGRGRSLEAWNIDSGRGSSHWSMCELLGRKAGVGGRCDAHQREPLLF